MNNCITYILHSKKINKYYIGYTCDVLELRIAKHNRLHKGFTSNGQPWELVYSETNLSQAEAMQREKEIKGWKSKKRITELIESTKG